MTSKDKTGAKLLTSVRKSKTGTVARKTSERQNTGKSAAKSKAPTTRSASTAAIKKSVSDMETNQDRYHGYSLGRRVWPD